MPVCSFSAGLSPPCHASAQPAIHTHTHRYSSDRQTDEVAAGHTTGHFPTNHLAAMVNKTSRWAGTALDPISSQWGRDYNGKIHCVTLAQYTSDTRHIVHV